MSAAWWAGLGAGIMALTRPYEGLWFCAIPAVAMMARLVHWKTENGKWKNKFTVSVAALAPVVLALAFLLIYNHAVTGNALKFPHRLYQEQQMPDVGVFAWDHPGPAPANRNPELSYQLHRFNPEVMFAPSVSLADLLRAHFDLLTTRIGGFFFQGLLGLGALLAIFSGQIFRRATGRLALGCFACFLFMLLTLRFFGFPHYAAAWTAPLAAIIILGFRSVSLWRWPGRRCASCFLMIVLPVWAIVTLALQTARGNPPRLWTVSRLEVMAQLEDQTTQDQRGHVVFVMMAEGQPAFAEWVYNDALIDDQTVIFARSLGRDKDISVERYYPNRHLWQAWLKPDGQLDHLTPYDPAEKRTSPATKG